MIDVNTKTYTIDELKSMLELFYDTHPKKNYYDSMYGDIALMIVEGVDEFLYWIESK